MVKEIKVVHGEIEQSLTKLKFSTEALQSNLPYDIGQGNALEVVTKINELNQMMGQMIEDYKQLLMRNEEQTRQAVQDMAQADRNLSSHMKVR
ncbi:YwqI/YxiC family protein [Bacillus sp. KH172YL63]|uniref:YwqI/YxiC family protein n=1 Tax=Bacillus sp. KH172YL63 TaxID=2709784 RepID=UPI0013E4D4E4|nr:YwqI/YxiC family protein [Bacillus sp. KH172YL63]BCB06057.1 hypothetical protein KH172YL63_41900 [Bacillus sp. KH172YL63]